MLIALALSAVLAQNEPAPAPPGGTPAPAALRLPEVVASLGYLGAGYAYDYGGVFDSFVALTVDGRFTRGMLVVEGELQVALPLSSNGPQSGLAVALRAGATGSRLAGTIGLLIHHTAGPAPFMPLPTLSASAKLGDFVASLGVFDRFALVPARVSLEWKGIGLSYLVPVGAELFARTRVRPEIGLEAHLLAFALFNAATVMATVGVVWSREGMP